jgi:carboxyl-terminal processing protease
MIRNAYRLHLPIKALLACLYVLSLSWSAATLAKPEIVPIDSLQPRADHAQTLLIVSKVLKRYHYRRHTLDDDLAAEILKSYVDSLDPNRVFFLRADVDGFSDLYATRLDDDVRKGDLNPAYSIFKTYRQRLESAISYALSRLDQGFDFSLVESYQIDREEAAWPLSLADRQDLWRKRIKNDFLVLRLAGKTDEDIQETLINRYQGQLRRAQQIDSDDIVQLYINAYAGSLEPHTGYMLPHNAENFDISMSLSLEGIGAVLGSEDEYTEIKEVVTGGPADLSGQLDAGDRILGVAQGEKGKMDDVIGWRLQDVVNLIRGPKGSTVRLSVLPADQGADGTPREVVLVRDKIKLEEQAAKQSVIEDIPGLEGLRIGVIEVPTFYRDFRAASMGEKDFRSTTRDVRRLLLELMEKKVDGVVVDLRNNGGGSLTEATALTGLFIPQGPVVQIRDYRGDVDLELDSDPEQVYGGPLAVLVNRNSASASEIFAGAIQDYGRGIVIGEPTFGKGTVQQLIELGNYLAGNQDIGRLRMTIAQFFRVNGGSTQHKGVMPDIGFPTVSEPDYGERSLDNALPWDSIRPATFDRTELGSIDGIRQRHEQRIATSPGFNYLKGERVLFDRMADQKLVSLNEDIRRAEREQRENERLRLRNEYRKSAGLDALSQSDVDLDDDDLVKQQREEEHLEEVQVKEAALILADMIRARSQPVIHAAQVIAD